jgi:hypothetical protein
MLRRTLLVANVALALPGCPKAASTARDVANAAQAAADSARDAAATLGGGPAARIDDVRSQVKQSEAQAAAATAAADAIRE